MGESENYLFFGTYCSLRSQSCLKNSAKWVNEVEWVSKVKVILWPWSKVTQILKLNVWLLACIIRGAIQGLRALLFVKCNAPGVFNSIMVIVVFSSPGVSIGVRIGYFGWSFLKTHIPIIHGWILLILPLLLGIGPKFYLILPHLAQ